MSLAAVFGAFLVATTPPTVPPTPPGTVAPTTTPATIPPTTVPGTVDPLGCAAIVHDPSGELDADAVTVAATRLATELGADLHVRAERDLDGGLDARMAQLEAQCPTWWAGTDRADNLVVVMYSSTEREASVFYGPGMSNELEFRWEHAVDEMGPRFADGEYTAGVVAGLEALGEDAPTTYQPSYDPISYDDEPASGSTGVPPAVWLLIGALVLVAVIQVVRYAGTGEWSDDGGGWSGTPRGSSWYSSGGSSSRRSSWSSGSRSSSRSSSGSRSSGRSGGGTKKW